MPNGAMRIRSNMPFSRYDVEKVAATAKMKSDPDESVFVLSSRLGFAIPIKICSYTHINITVVGYIYVRDEI